MPYDLSIIIVNWNGGSLLARCVETVVSSSPKVTYEIVVIDNASEDDSLAQLRASEVATPNDRQRATPHFQELRKPWLWSGQQPGLRAHRFAVCLPSESRYRSSSGNHRQVDGQARR